MIWLHVRFTYTYAQPLSSSFYLIFLDAAGWGYGWAAPQRLWACEVGVEAVFARALWNGCMALSHDFVGRVAACTALSSNPFGIRCSFAKIAVMWVIVYSFVLLFLFRWSVWAMIFLLQLPQVSTVWTEPAVFSADPLYQLRFGFPETFTPRAEDITLPSCLRCGCSHEVLVKKWHAEMESTSKLKAA